MSGLNRPLRLLCGLAAASLIACQSAPLPTANPARGQVASSPQPKAATRRLSPKTGQAELAAQVSQPLMASLKREGESDRLSLRLGRGFARKASAASPTGFRTQAFDAADIDSMVVTVSGPGILTPIVSASIPVTGPGPFSLDLSGIPRGVNRVVTAQFYDADGNAIPVAVAMAVYSSSSGGEISLQLRRRYVPLGRILAQLPANLRESVDAEALQAQLDDLIFGVGNDPELDPILVDPARVDVAAILADLNGNSGTVGDYSNPGVYALVDGGLDYSITGLVPNDEYSLRIGDPSSAVLDDTAASGTLGTVTPGRWPVRVFLPEGVAYSFDETSIDPLEFRIVEGSSDDIRVLDILNVDFTPGVDFTFDPVFDYPTPTVDTLSASSGNRGFELTISGTGFHTADKDQNVVDFNDGSANLATVISATATELVVEVPDVASLGDYNVTVAVGPKTSQESHSFTIKGVWYVKTAADGGTEGAAGDSWETAVTLQDALARAENGEELWIKGGSTGNPAIYKPSDLDREASFEIHKDLSLIGGFAGTESASEDRDPEANPVVLSGDLEGDDSFSTPATLAELDPGLGSRDDNSYNVVRNFGSDAFIKDLRIEGGNANHPTADTMIGEPEGCTLGLDCDFEVLVPNPLRYGGGIDNAGGLTLSGVTVIHNSAVGSGGGISSLNPDPFGGSMSFELAGSDFFAAPEAGLPESLITENRALLHGGGIYLAGAIGDLSHATISRNFSTSGAGIYLGDGIEGANGLYDLRVLANQASEDGGGLYSEQGRIDTVRSAYIDNRAEDEGGGIAYVSSGPGNFEAYSNLVARNQAAFGGGIFIDVDASFCCPTTTNLDFNASSFFANQATGGDGSGDPERDGSAIYLANTQNLYLHNDLFAANSIARGAEATVNLEHCLFPEASIAALVHDNGSFSTAAAAGSNNQAAIADPLFRDPDLLDGSGQLDITGLRPLSGSAAKANGDAGQGGDTDLSGSARNNPPSIGAFEAE